jgi:hypothetical protein
LIAGNQAYFVLTILMTTIFLFLEHSVNKLADNAFQTSTTTQQHWLAG